MITITLDTNCLIDVEEKREGYLAVLEILKMHEEKKINIAVVATSAVDKKIDNLEIKNFKQFQQWLKSIRFGNVEILAPIAYYDISFWDWSLWAGPELEELDHNIHKILFPKLPFENPGQNLSDKWVNAKNDVLIMWAHIWNKRQFFITRDDNFLKDAKKIKLEQLGARRILTPKDFSKVIVKGSDLGI